MIFYRDTSKNASTLSSIIVIFDVIAAVVIIVVISFVIVVIVFVVVILLIDVAVFLIDVVNVIGCPKILFCFAIFSIIKIIQNINFLQQ